MANENKTETAAKVEPIKAEAGKRKRSSISFPYYTLDDAIAVAKAINGQVGSTNCTLDQVAAWLGMSAKSSGLRARMTAASMFGLVDNTQPEAIHLGEWGRLVVDAKREREGRAKAFLNVPLFRAVYDKHKGEALPPTAALENELIAIGVAETLKGTARSVMERSAESAGFFEAGDDRLVMPGFKPSDGQKPERPEFGGGSGGPPSAVHPMIGLLIAALPPGGSPWPKSARANWLQAIAQALDMVYPNDDTAAS